MRGRFVPSKGSGVLPENVAENNAYIDALENAGVSATDLAALAAPSPTIDHYIATETHFYYGFLKNGDWTVRRQERLSGANQDATQTNNSDYATLAAAWVARDSLNYGG